MKTCSRCGIDRLEEEFHWRSQVRGTRKSACKACTATNDALAYREGRRRGARAEQALLIRKRNTDYVLNLLKKSECVDCNENDIRVLEFDHLRDKFKGIARMMSYSLEKLQKEIDKCEVVCANCHRKRTYERSGAARHLIALGLDVVG